MYGDFMNEYLNIIIKTFILYFFLIITLKIMGKREIGELSLFDVAVIFIISEILSISISNPSKSILVSIIPILVIVILEILISRICYKSEKIRNLIYGKPEIIIINGKLNLELMNKERYNINDLINQLHEQNIYSPSEVKFAVLETNGKITVLKKGSNIKWPEPIIKDGKLKTDVVKILKIDIKKFNNELRRRGYISYKNILLCYVLENDLYIQEKMFSNKE